MNVKDAIEKLIKRNDDTLNFLNEHGRDNEKADETIYDYLKKFREQNIDSGLTNDFANCLQLSNDKGNFEQYGLEDVRRLFESMLRLQEYNLETYVELGHFEYAVMDNADKAKKLIDEGVKKAKEKILELERLKNSIESDK